MKRLSRLTALKLAAILACINALSGFAMSIPLIPRGAAYLDQVVDSPPYFVVAASFALSIVMAIGAYGTWTNQRWGIILLLLSNAIGALLSAPGIFAAPTKILAIAATFGTLFSIMIIILCLWRDPKPMARAQMPHHG